MSQTTTNLTAKSENGKPATVKERADLALNNDFYARLFVLPRRDCVMENKKQLTIMATGKSGVNVGGKSVYTRSPILITI